MPVWSATTRGESRRHSYTITAAGRQALTDWLTDPSKPVLEMRNEALLRLRFAAVHPPRRAPDARARHARPPPAADRQLEAQVKTGEFDDIFETNTLTTEYALEFNRWARDWCANAEQEILAAQV